MLLLSDAFLPDVSDTLRPAAYPFRRAFSLRCRHLTFAFSVELLMVRPAFVGQARHTQAILKVRAMKSIQLLALSLSLAGIVGGPLSQPAVAGTAAELNASGKAALDRLYAQSDRARRYSRDARAILVFPKIIKAGFMHRRTGGRRRSLRSRPTSRLLQDRRRLLRPSGRWAVLQLRAVPDERCRAYLSQEEQWMGDRLRAQRGRRRQRRRYEHDFDNARERCLRVPVRTEGTDGRPRIRRLEDYAHQKVGPLECDAGPAPKNEKFAATNVLVFTFR